MAQTLVDFDASTAGSTPTGWTRRQANSVGGWTVVSNTARDGATKGLVGSFTVSDRNMLSYDALDGISAAMEIFAQFKTTSAANGDARFTLRGYGAIGSGNGYTLGWVNGVLRISKLTNGSPTNFGADLAYSISANTWYNIVVRANGTALSVKMWADGDTEPGSPQKTATDSTYAAAGWNGPHQFVITGNTTFDRYFGFGTAGDAAPRTPPTQGSATGGFNFTSAAAGQTSKSGAAVGGFSFTSVASGQTAKSGITAGGFNFTGSATGTTPPEAPASGSTTGTITWTSAASGTSNRGGAASGEYNWASAAEGDNGREGQAEGTVTWAATADGTATYSGEASGTITWAGGGFAPLPDFPDPVTAELFGTNTHASLFAGVITAKVFTTPTHAASPSGQLVTVRIYE